MLPQHAVIERAERHARQLYDRTSQRCHDLQRAPKDRESDKQRTPIIYPHPQRSARQKRAACACVSRQQHTSARN